MARKKIDRHTVERKASEKCSAASSAWFGGESSRAKASVMIGVENGMKLDEVSDKLDAMTDAFNRLAAAIEENNALTKRALDDPRGVKKLKMGNEGP